MMEIGAYLFVAGIIWLIWLALRPRVRRKLGAYAGLSLLLALSDLILFYLLSTRAGLLRIGVMGSLSIVRPGPAGGDRPAPATDRRSAAMPLPRLFSTR
ncbi:MAG: hypothetical protein NT169_12215 [Chloroflexi bacterium]|nr:hypothetical protein [Chloroflexota bacterium]